MKNKVIAVSTAGLVFAILFSACGQRNNHNLQNSQDMVSNSQPHGKTIVLSTTKPYQLITFEEPGCIYCEALSDELTKMSKADPSLFSNIQWTRISVSPDNTNTYVLKVDNHRIKGNSIKLAYDFQLMGFPTSFFLDKSGKLILRLNGYYPEQGMKCVFNYINKQLYKHENINEAC